MYDMKKLFITLIQSLIGAAIWGFPFFLYFWNLK